MHDVEAGERAAGMAALLAALLRDEPRGEWLGRLAADEVFAEDGLRLMRLAQIS